MQTFIRLTGITNLTVLVLVYTFVSVLPRTQILGCNAWTHLLDIPVILYFVGHWGITNHNACGSHLAPGIVLGIKLVAPGTLLCH